MKEKTSKVGKFFLSIIFIPFFLLICICFLLYTPIDFIRYRKTRYYKDTKEKYTWLSTVSYYVRLYDIIKNADMPIEYFRCTEVSLNGYGYFIYKNILIFNNYELCYDSEINAWTVEIEDEYIRVEEAVKQDIQNFNEFMKVDVADRAVILVDNEEIFEGVLPEIENCEVLLTSQSGTATALQNFIANHS
ncbi:MAG: hypothetical protein PHH84_06345 [Oscillospiraceae bacterium]|nr:hypothetical protein [Oscillospiraceae bacterium]MDD4413933.1 hypothetical protein [Oscillospiraceae bacterium]